MANNDTVPQHVELDNVNDAPIVPASSLKDSHLLTGKKLAIAFAAMLLSLLRTFTNPDPGACN